MSVRAIRGATQVEANTAEAIAAGTKELLSEILRANALPVGQAVLRNTDAFFVFLGDGVVEPDTLDEAAVATGALVSNNDIEKRAGFCTTTSESNDDHDLSFG